MLLKQSTNRNRSVLMVDSVDHITGKPGLTLTITAGKDGGAFGSISPTVTDRGNGWYTLALTTSHTDTLGDFALHVTASGADPVDLLDQVVADLPGATVATVTGNVNGNVAGSVGSVTTVDDKTGYRLSTQGVADINTTTMTESYGADGSEVTIAQALYMLLALQMEKNISGTTVTVKKLDGSTTAMTLTINSATNPSTITRAS